jgi:hypothetical protein
VCAGPVLLEFFGHAFGDEMDGKAAGVGGDDGAGLAELRKTREEFALDIEVFGDDFDDPIGFGDAGEVVFEIANGDFFGQRRGEKSGGAGLFCGFEASADDFVSIGGRGVRLEIGRNDIEKDAGQAGVGEMGGDTSTHGASSEDDCFLDRTSHEGPSCCDVCERTGYKTSMAGSNGRVDGQKNYTESAETAEVTERRGSYEDYGGSMQSVIESSAFVSRFRKFKRKHYYGGESGGFRMVLRCQKER